jgi:hypothetical protein
MAKDKNKEKKSGNTQQPENYSVKDYVYINLIFWAFLLLVAVVVFFTTGGKWDHVMGNVFTFIFLVFGLGFTCVSVFDFLYEKIAAKDEKN